MVNIVKSFDEIVLHNIKFITIQQYPQKLENAKHLGMKQIDVLIFCILAKLSSDNFQY